MNLSKKDIYVFTVCLGVLLFLPFLIQLSVRPQGVMTLHFQGVTTNENGTTRYVFVLTNNAYDCLVEPSVLWHQGDKLLGPYPYILPPGKLLKRGTVGTFVFEDEGVERWAINHETIKKWQAEFNCRRIDVSSLSLTLEGLNAMLAQRLGVPRIFNVERTRVIRSEQLEANFGTNHNAEPISF